MRIWSPFAALLTVAGILGAPASAAAQPRVDPGVVIEGQVGVRVYVTLNDEDIPYVPVTQHRMTMTGNDGDTIVVRTDDAGVITVLARPGEYRLTSSEPVSWRGTTYRWDVPVLVRRDMRLIDLRPRNAIRDGQTAAVRGPLPGPGSP
jgi:hypothetical protein